MNSLTSKVNFALVILLLTGFTALFLFDTISYDLLSREDHIVEYLSSVFLLLSSLFLIVAFIYIRKSKHLTHRWLIILLPVVSAIFFVVAVEEISWGQRIFDLTTPDYLSSINDQNEINFHNINKKFFDRLLDWAIIIFVLISSVLYLLKKEETLGVKNPDVFLVCAYTLVPFYRQEGVLGFYHLLYIPMALLLLNSIKNKSPATILTLVITSLISVIVPIIHWKNYHLFPLHNNSANEYREFLFCFCTLAYSYEIMNNLDVNKETNNLVRK